MNGIREGDWTTPEEKKAMGWKKAESRTRVKRCPVAGCEDGRRGHEPRNTRTAAQDAGEGEAGVSHELPWGEQLPNILHPAQ